MALRSARATLRALSLICIGLALAVTTAAFAVVDGLLYRALPFDRPEELAVLSYRQAGREVPRLAYDPALEPERQRLRAAILDSGLVQAATEILPSGFLGSPGGDLRLSAVQVDTDFFRVFGLRAFRGSLHPENLTRSVAHATGPTVVLGHGLWERLGHPELGPVTMEGRAVVVVAIMPPQVKFPGETNVWIVGTRLSTRPPTHVRLAPGGSVSALASRVEPMVVWPLRAAMVPAGTDGIVGLLLAAGLVVLIAWVQLAGLTVADQLERMRDLGLRLTLGATPSQIVATSLGWHGLTAASVGLGAWLAAPIAVRAFVLTLPAELTHGQYVSLDARSAIFLVITVAVGFGLLACAPMWALRIPPLSLLRGHIGGAAVRVARLRRLLVIAQVAVGAALMYASGVLWHSMVNAVRYDYGFKADDVHLFEPPLPAGESVDFEYRSREKARLTSLTVEQLRARTDVVAAAVLYQIPFGRVSRINSWEALRSFGGRPLDPGTEVYCTNVGREFVSALGASMVQGRDLNDPDHRGRFDVALVNTTFARMFGGSVEVEGEILPINVIGKTIETTWFKGAIVGVVRDLVMTKVTDAPVPQVFVPARDGALVPFVAIRTLNAAGLSSGARAQLEKLWGPLPDSRFSLLKDYWDRSLIPFRGQAQVVGLLALFAIPLAAIGVASFMLFLVRAQNRATAIRMAIGAEPAQVRHEVLLMGLATSALGLAAGVVMGIALGWMMRARLFGVHGFDPASLIVTVGLFAALSVAATWLPARIASQTNPSVLLRESAD